LVIRSEISVTVWTKLSALPLSVGKALKDQGEHEPAGEGSSDRDLGTLVGDLRRALPDGGWGLGSPTR
jgi:hypothetical protein